MAAYLLSLWLLQMFWRQAQSASCRVATAICMHEILWRLARAKRLQVCNCNLTTPDFWRQASASCRVAAAIWFQILWRQALCARPPLLKASLSPHCSGFQLVATGPEEIWLFQGGRLYSRSHCFHALVVYSLSPVYWGVFQCCGILFPEVRWFGSFPWSRTVLRAAARCEMNGVFLHVHGHS